jgi:hypothetical protein
MSTHRPVDDDIYPRGEVSIDEVTGEEVEEIDENASNLGS